MYSQLEQLGEEGRVEEAQDLMKIVEHLEKERERERLKLTGGGPKVNASSLGQSIFIIRTFLIFFYRCWLVLNWIRTIFMRRWNFVMCVGRSW
jgi:hypothetical protein